MPNPNAQRRDQMTEPLDSIFPPVERVVYEKSPLVQVLCQVRYPAVLKIESELPAAFQERVRDAYPIFERTTESVLGTMPKGVGALLSAPSFEDRVHSKFSTEDGNWTLSLLRDSMSLTTGKYTRWREFRRMVVPCLQALVEIYKPSYYTRVGLRYINRIERSKLNLENVAWSELITPAVLGELASSEIASCALEASRRLRLQVPGLPDLIGLQHGLHEEEGEAEHAYMIDFDFYIDKKTGVPDASEILDRFNRHADRVFRWCILDRLHHAIGPSPIGAHAAQTA